MFLELGEPGDLRTTNLDTDGSVRRQGLGQYFKIDSIDLADLRNHLQFYSSVRAMRKCASRLDEREGEGATCHLLGSGDFHHITLLMLERMASPFFLIVFDNHMDSSFAFPKYHCGNWMYHASSLPLCRKIIHVGSTEGQGVFGRYAARSGKIEVLEGRECEGFMGLERFKKTLAEARVEGLPVYASVDKDVLERSESPGDWDNGVMRMSDLSWMLEHVAKSFKVAGADITGETGGRFRYSKKPVKNLFSYIEHPSGRAEGAIEADLKQMLINFEILDIFGVEHVAS
ncbi:MAG: arginase family protein [Deltaproteobacteria bacterium]|nr:arginase family protein [Deltaproteobacteria bacterium]